ncbi:serine/threonine-protein kinase [Streptomyces odontomachi]|uniref:serine/threonine-protein kinase n=1 Tax=Streptomyces odontomachi TaxID=2944940 RepID=UPI0021095AE9|nr:serine/threonine-protein kinase [Streptomyces sp. ODS25]
MIGGYRIERRIGAGGMGVVHLAVSPSGRRVALKIIRGEFVDDPDRRARFRLEIDAARQVSGAFTASVVDADPDADPPWMATQYFAAPTLAERVRDAGAFEEDAVWTLGRGLAEALRDIHRAGLVHRDLKPSNVLLTDDGPRVIDFGIARMLAAEPLTRTGNILGTVSFMAPEQLSTPREVGPAADVFALGGVLAHAATGRGPFDSDTGTPPVTVAMKIVHDDPDLSAVPPGLRSVIGKCLLKDPAGRPSPAELLALLQGEERGERGEAYGAAAGPAPEAAPRPAPKKPALRRSSAYALAIAASSAVLAGVLVGALLHDGGGGNDDAHAGGTGSSPSSGAGTDAASSSKDSCGKGITTGGSKDVTGKKITIGVTLDRPGLAMKQPDGDYLGLDVDVATYVAGKLGYARDEIVWKEVSACHRLEALQTDTVDLVAGLTQTAARSAQIAFSSPYLTGHQDLLLPADGPDVHKGTDLSGKKVCAVGGSSAAAGFRRTFGPKATLHTDTSVERCVHNLTEHSVNAVTADDTALAYTALLEPSTFKLAGLRLTNEPYAIGIRKGDPVKDKVDVALKQMVADGTMSATLHRYLPLLA